MAPFDVCTAILSDVHGNLPALNAVLADIDEQGIEEIVCLGGLITFGPNPEALLSTLRERTSVCLQGSYEVALLSGDTHTFDLRPQEALLWHRARLKPGFFAKPSVRTRWRWLGSLPERYERPGLLAVHGHPSSPLWGHIPFSVDASGVSECFAAVERILFAGYLCQPFALTEDGSVRTAAELDMCIDTGEGKIAICPGSVGQPHDRDPRASYSTFDGETVTWRRIEYDVEEAAAALEASDLPYSAIFAARLREGI